MGHLGLGASFKGLGLSAGTLTDWLCSDCPELTVTLPSPPCHLGDFQGYPIPSTRLGLKILSNLGGAHQVVLQASFLPCTLELLPVVLGEPLVVPRIGTQVGCVQDTSLPSVKSLRPHGLGDSNWQNMQTACSKELEYMSSVYDFSLNNIKCHCFSPQNEFKCNQPLIQQQRLCIWTAKGLQGETLNVVGRGAQGEFSICI